MALLNSLFQSDHRNLAPVGRLALQGGAPETEKIILLKTGVVRKQIYVGDARFFESRVCIGLKVKKEARRARRGDETGRIICMIFKEMLTKFRPHLVGFLGDAGAMVALICRRSAPSFTMASSVDSMTPPKATLPSSVRGADDAVARIGE